MTTGAFYGYFSSKEALFASIVEPHAAAIMGRFMQAQQDFAELPEAEQPQHVGVESTKCTEWMVDYIYQHMDACKLLICCAEGTSYETFVHNMVEVEVESTFRFLEVLRRLGHPIPVLDRQLCHIIKRSRPCPRPDRLSVAHKNVRKTFPVQQAVTFRIAQHFVDVV